MTTANRVRRSGLAAALALALVGVPVPADAHLGHVILRAERYLKLDASDEDTRLVVSLTLGASEGARVLAAADADGDHEVTQAESDAYLAQWADGLRTDVPVEIDGSPVPVTWTEGYMEPIGPVAPTALTVEITAHLPVTAREHLIRFRDHMRREVFDRTDVAFRAHDGAELIASGEGESPTGVQNDLAFGSESGGGAPGGPPPDVMTARVRYPRRSEAPAAGVVALPIAVLALVGASLVAWRRRRR